MKKTPFLSYILAALLACSVVPQALASTIRIDYDTKDKELDVDDDVGWDCTWDDDREMWFSNYQLELYADCSIINGGWSAPIYISDGITLTLAAARDWEELKSGELLYWSNDIDMADLDDDEILMINMRDGSTLDYRNNDLWLGQMSFAGKSMYGYDPTVNLKCNDLVTVSICNRTRDFSIDAHIHFINAWSRLRIEAGTNAVFLNCDQDINLAVDKNDAIYMTGGRFISGYGYRTRLNGATLNLPDGATSKIEGYLCGTSTITLGDGTTVQGRNETSGSYQYFSWLLNDIEVRENCSALMTAGYYGGNITMQKGSSLQFYMGLVPAGVDEEHWYGGAGVFMKGGNTLDIGGGAHPFALIVEGEGNTVSHGTLLWNESSTGSASITKGSLTLNDDLTMAENATASLNGDATLDLGGQTRAFGLTVAGTGNTLKNGAFIGTLTLAENSTLVSDSAMASWDGPTSIVMKNGSRLEMATGTGKDRWINDISALQVEGTATVVNAYLRIKPGETYTLGNGVQNLVGEGQSFLSLDYSTLDLAKGEISKLDIRVWPAFAPYENVIKNGTLNTYVEIDPSAKLWLDGVTLGDNASFTMGNNTQLDMGGAGVGLVKFTFTGESATINNGTLWVEEGEDVKLGADLSGTGVLELRGGSLDLDNTSLANETTVTGDASISNGQIKTGVNIDSSCKLTLDGVSIGSDASFIMGDKAQLDLGTAEARLSKFTFGDAATVDNGTLWVGNEDAYTLNTNFAGTYKLELRGGSLDLANTSLAKETTVTGNATVSGGTINASVIINASNALALDGVTIGNNASFTMGNLAQLDLGEASIGLDKFTLEESTATVDNGMLDLGAASYTLGIADAASVIYLDQNHALQLGAGAAVSNGRLCLPGSTNDTPIDYTLNLQGCETSSPAGSGVTLNLGENVTFATNHNTRFLLNEECIGNPDCPVNIDVTANGHFILGDSSRDQTVYGDVNLTHTGDGPAATPGAYDVEMNYRLIGNLTAEMNGRSINIGNIGDDRQDTHPGTTIVTEASDATVGSFTGEALKLIAGGAVTINGDVTSTGSADLTGGSVSIKGSIASAEAEVQSTSGDISIDGTLSAQVSSILNSAENITIGDNVTGGSLTATAAQSITLQAITIGDNAADLTATGGSIAAAAFTGASLTAEAAGAVTINGNVASTDNTDLTGASVSVNGSLTSTAGSIYVKSTDGDITIAGDLSAKGSSLLDSAGSITLGTLDNTGNITAGGNVTGGTLTATAADSILMGNIGTSKTPVGDTVLTATGGSITAGKVNTGKLTATAAGSITMNDVKVSQTGAQIVSTGEGMGEEEYANVVLNSFHGAGAQIEASHGSITVEKSVSGAGKDSQNELYARVGVHFKGTADDNNLLNTDIFTPVLNWDSAARLTNVRVYYWDGSGGSPTAPVNVTVGGSLYMENSSMVGDVQITTPTEEEQKVTVDHSTITGQVSGARELVLDSGSVGSVKRGDTLTVVSSGTSAITALTDGQQIDNLTLNGGSLTVTNRDRTQGQLRVTELTVTENTKLISHMELSTYQQTPPSEGELANAKMYFYLTAANEKKETGTTALLDMQTGSLTATAPYDFGCTVVPGYLTIDVRGNDLEWGRAYALLSTNSDSQPEFWNTDLNLSFTNDSLVQSAADLFWENGTLYYQRGAELTEAVWAPEETRLWNTTDHNWFRYGDEPYENRYLYQDGVTVLFNDTAFDNIEGYEGDVYLEGDYTPSNVQVNNGAGHNYTFKGDGKIAGTTTLTKEGEGSLTIQNANSYSGGTILKQGTLVVANAGALGSGDVTQVGGTLKLSFDGQTPEFSSVSLDGGTIKITNGAKAFNLYVDGTDNLLEGNANDAFTGNLTLLEKSSLVSNSALAGQNGPASIVLKDGSTLKLATGEGMNNWINDITNLHVEGEATMVDAYLRINPYTNGGMYTLDNGVQNLKGEGVTAYCLDGSTFNLNYNTTNLDIIVGAGQTNKVVNGQLGTTVDIRSGSKLTVLGLQLKDGGAFLMGDKACLDMSYITMRLGVFSFTGKTATIDNGTLLVESGESVQLGTDLQGSAIISLNKEANLDLNGYIMASNKIRLADDSASVSGGTLSGDMTVASGKTLHLGVEQSITGDVKLNSSSKLGLGSDCIVGGAISGSGTIMKEGIGTSALSGNALQNFTGSLEVQGGILNLLNAASVNVQDVTIQYGSLGVYSGESTDEAGEATLTITGGHTLTAGMGATLNANLVMGGGATLDVSAMAGLGGLQMGSTVTLNPGLVLLSDEDMDAVGALGFMGKYDLFNSVDGLSLDGTSNFLAELGLADKWVKAADVFANDLFKEAEKEYYVFYSGANQAGGAGGNVGTVYIMQIPEPTTSTLSLLALAALAARRRKD